MFLLMKSLALVYFNFRFQDALALQVMELSKSIFDDTNLGLYLYPYKVIPSRTGRNHAEGGIIECVPDVKSRDQVSPGPFPLGKCFPF